MAHLHLLRHGQASFGSANYDRLSELGQRQAGILGSHLEQIGPRFAGMVSGRLARQQATAEHARQRMSGPLPETATDPAFDEYDADGLFRAYLPRVLAADPELNAQQRELFRSRALFQRAFLGVARCWTEGAPSEGVELESWETFRSRVHEGLERLNRSYDRDAQVAVFTSGGVIAVGAAAALGLSPERTLLLNWGVFNASITELSFRRSGLYLLGFNNITHLKLAGDPALITHR